MERLIGNKLDVHLKCDETVSGIMFDTDDRHVYIQNNVNTFIAIPRENIKYYIGSSLHNTGDLVKTLEPKLESHTPTAMVVCVNGVEVAQIPVPDDMNLASCSEQVLKLIWSSPAVHNAIRGKVQKSLEYDIGYANITTIDSEEPDHSKIQNTFGMNVGSIPPSTPFEMARAIGGKHK